jgi:hypothetical protein
VVVAAATAKALVRRRDTVLGTHTVYALQRLELLGHLGHRRLGVPEVQEVCGA